MNQFWNYCTNKVLNCYRFSKLIKALAIIERIALPNLLEILRDIKSSAILCSILALKKKLHKVVKLKIKENE